MLSLKPPLKMIPFSQQLTEGFVALTMQMISTEGRQCRMRCKRLAFNKTLSEDYLKKLLERTNLPVNCKTPQAKLVNLVTFSTLSPAIRNTGMKVKDIQNDYPKVTAYLLQLLARLIQMFFEAIQMLIKQNTKLRSYK